VRADAPAPGLLVSPDARLRVLVVGHGPPTAGGIPSFVTSLSGDPWLRERIDLSYLNTAPHGEDKEPGSFSIGNVRRTLAHAWAINRQARGRDLVHLNLAAAPTLPLLRAVVLTLAARLAGTRAILHAHTGLLEECVRRRGFRWLLRFELSLAGLILVSRSAMDAVRPLGTVFYLQNGVDPAAFSTGPKDAAPPLLVYVGTIAERKGLIDLRDALVELRGHDGALPIRVTIVGDGEQEGPGAMQRILDAYRAAGLGAVEFAGALPHDEVARLLSRAAIFCLPSHSEGLPLSLLEGMAAGAAVVATYVGDVPSVLEDGAAGLLVPPGKPEALAGALRRLVEEPQTRAALGAAARLRIERRYSQAAMVHELLDIYRAVARSNREAGQGNPIGRSSSRP
jgi:glycosyltransferase involved in cell wall biosynthesis